MECLPSTTTACSWGWWGYCGLCQTHPKAMTGEVNYRGWLKLDAQHNWANE